MLHFNTQCKDINEVRWEMFTSHYGKFNQDNMYQILSESVSCCKRYDKKILARFSVPSSNCCSLAKQECQVSQGSVDTLFKTNKKQNKTKTNKKSLVCSAHWKTFTFLCSKFTQDNKCQILSKPVGFCIRYDRKHFDVFLAHSVVNVLQQLTRQTEH